VLPACDPTMRPVCALTLPLLITIAGTDGQEENKPVCSCIEGENWKFKGKQQSYFANPTSSYLYLYATILDGNDTFLGDGSSWQPLPAASKHGRCAVPGMWPAMQSLSAPRSQNMLYLFTFQ
jgi:hypothetical protein